MSNFKEYKLVKEESENGLERTVNSLMKDGWQPIGGICTAIVKEPFRANIGSGQVFYQSMVR